MRAGSRRLESLRSSSQGSTAWPCVDSSAQAARGEGWRTGSVKGGGGGGTGWRWRGGGGHRARSF